MRLLTVGHSNRSLDEFLRLLDVHGVAAIADVRTVPRSLRNPQFNRESLPLPLAAAGIGYRHMKDLGGWRKPRPDSPNQGLTNDSFRGYADHMRSAAFEKQLAALIKVAEDRTLAIMCAEAVPWRCHRSLIADALAARGIEVEHITGPGARRRHRLMPWVEIMDGRVTYPFVLKP